MYTYKAVYIYIDMNVCVCTRLCENSQVKGQAPFLMGAFRRTPREACYTFLPFLRL